MNKKKIILICIILIAIIMLFPVKHELKDGGSIEYKAILYDVTNYKQIPMPEYPEAPSFQGLEIRILGITVYSELDN